MLEYDNLRELGVIKNGHFALSSNRHSLTYLDKMPILSNPEAFRMYTESLARLVKYYQPHIIVGPSLGGAIIAAKMAALLNARAVFAERAENGRRTIERCDPAVWNKIWSADEPRVFVVDDTITTGTTIRETIHAIYEWHRERNLRFPFIVGVGAFFDRGEKFDIFNITPEFVQKIPLASYNTGFCPGCRDDEPIVKIGGW